MRTPSTVVHRDTAVVEHAVLCADGRVHYGPEYLHGDDPDRVREVADNQTESGTWCGGMPHKLAKRERITTAWRAAS